HQDVDATPHILPLFCPFGLYIPGSHRWLPPPPLFGAVQDRSLFLSAPFGSVPDLLDSLYPVLAGSFRQRSLDFLSVNGRLAVVAPVHRLYCKPVSVKPADPHGPVVHFGVPPGQGARSRARMTLGRTLAGDPKIPGREPMETKLCRTLLSPR